MLLFHLLCHKLANLELLTNDTSKKPPEPTEFVLAICSQSAAGGAVSSNLETSLQRTGFFWNENASHVSSASQMEEAWDANVDKAPILFWCLDIWAAMAASNESQLNGICWRHWELSATGAASKSWGTSASRSPTLMLVRLSAHSPADSAVPLLNLSSP